MIVAWRGGRREERREGEGRRGGGEEGRRGGGEEGRRGGGEEGRRGGGEEGRRGGGEEGRRGGGEEGRRGEEGEEGGGEEGERERERGRERAVMNSVCVIHIATQPASPTNPVAVMRSGRMHPGVCCRPRPQQNCL